MASRSRCRRGGRGAGAGAGPFLSLCGRGHTAARARRALCEPVAPSPVSGLCPARPGGDHRRGGARLRAVAWRGHGAGMARAWRGQGAASRVRCRALALRPRTRCAHDRFVPAASRRPARPGGVSGARGSNRKPAGRKRAAGLPAAMPARDGSQRTTETGGPAAAAEASAPEHEARRHRTGGHRTARAVLRPPLPAARVGPTRLAVWPCDHGGLCGALRQPALRRVARGSAPLRCGGRVQACPPAAAAAWPRPRHRFRARPGRTRPAPPPAPGPASVPRAPGTDRAG